MSSLTSSVMFYDLYQKKKRIFEKYDELMIVTFDPAKADMVAEKIDDSKYARVTDLKAKRRFKGHQGSNAKDLENESNEHLDINYHYGFARIEVLNKTKIDGTIAALKQEGWINAAMYAQREILEGNQRSPPYYFIPQLFIVKLKDTSSLQPDTFFSNQNIEKTSPKKTSRVYVASIPTNAVGENEEEKLEWTIRKFNGTAPNEQNPEDPNPDIEFSTPEQASFNDQLSAPPNPTDLSYGPYQWALKDTVAGSSYGCNVFGAWHREWNGNAASRFLGRSEVIVAVVDTGCDANHQDFSDNIPLTDALTPPWDPNTTSFHPTSPGIDDYDGSSHGTSVCAVITAKTSYAKNSTGTASLGIAGIAPSCKIMPIKVDLTAGTAADRADAITYVADRASIAGTPNRYIMNLSWKFDGDSSIIKAAIDTAIANNVLVVCAAGDVSSGDGIEVGNWTGPSTGNVWPASYPGVIPVIATKKSVGTTTPLRLRRADSNFRAGVAIFAPGQDIRTYNNNNNATYYKHKTSLAAAVVSGIAALAWSYDRKVNGGFNLMANSGSTPNLRGILTTVNGSGGALGALRTDGLTTSATPSTSPDDSKGIGRIDARYALDAVPGAPAPSWPSLS